MSIRTPMRIVGFLAAAAALVWLLTGPHVWWSPTFSFRLIDKSSRLPIPNAIVVATWTTHLAETSYRKTVALQEAISDADGNVVIQGWGPRPVVIGGLSSSEPKVRIVHRQYRITVLQPEPDYVDAHMSLEVPWANTDVVLEPSAPHEESFGVVTRIDCFNAWMK